MNVAVKSRAELLEVIAVIAIAAAAFSFGVVVEKQDSRDQVSHQKRVDSAHMEEAVRKISMAATIRRGIDQEIERLVQRAPASPAIADIQQDLSDFDISVAAGRWFDDGETHGAIFHLTSASERLNEAEAELRSQGIL